MIDVRTVLLPTLLRTEDVEGRAVVVFDVLRATTTITTALENGAKELRVFKSLDAASRAAGKFDGPKLLAGELKCLPPPGFDMGNSPEGFKPEYVEGRTVFFSTTNGTMALLAARRAARLFAGCIRNARAVAAVLEQLRLPVTLLCAGTEGGISIEDTIGCGAVFGSMNSELVRASGDAMLIARQMNDSADLFIGKAADNLRRVNLESDIDFCRQFGTANVVPECDPATMTLRPFTRL
jgi:2-phosphosulfolactate phosphatase